MAPLGEHLRHKDAPLGIYLSAAFQNTSLLGFPQFLAISIFADMLYVHAAQGSTQSCY